jgi:hypothetical protein
MLILLYTVNDTNNLNYGIWTICQAMPRLLRVLKKLK